MKKHCGFTLVELMIAIAIVAILVALAVPSYQNWVRKANRGEAQALLLNWANNQEVWRNNNPSYGGAGDIPVPTHERYDFFVVAGTNTFTRRAEARAVGGQDQDAERGTDCGILTVDQSGTKGANPVCWQE